MNKLVCLVMLGLPWPELAAQQPNSVKTGDKVRVSAPALELKEEVGRVAATRRDTIVLTGHRNTDSLPIPVAAITRLDVSAGRGPLGWKGAGVGALIGGGAGALAGIVVGSAVGNAFDAFDGSGSSEIGGAVVGAVFGGVFGASAGALIGALIPGERWKRADMPIAVNVVGLRQGTRLGFVVAF